uniref:Uncharacterized protein n=1 Tax=Oryza glumipatula TaxID=40148 RepID=A0A0E0ATF1_9ORYZ
MSRVHQGMVSPPEKKLPTDSTSFPILASIGEGAGDPIWRRERRASTHGGGGGGQQRRMRNQWVGWED